MAAGGNENAGGVEAEDMVRFDFLRILRGRQEGVRTRSVFVCVRSQQKGRCIRYVSEGEGAARSGAG
jgi:hypothetical protein